jgi:hypothetical protein
MRPSLAATTPTCGSKKKFVELDVPLYVHPTVYLSPEGSIPDPLYLDFYKKKSSKLVGFIS